jgi:hypothetical protein
MLIDVSAAVNIHGYIIAARVGPTSKLQTR